MHTFTNIFRQFYQVVKGHYNSTMSKIKTFIRIKIYNIMENDKNFLQCFDFISCMSTISLETFINGL